MKVKNVGKKIIGNREFYLLPGEEMEVVGDEEWVKMYMDYGNLKEIEDPKPESAPEAESASEAEATAENQEVKKSTTKKTATK